MTKYFQILSDDKTLRELTEKEYLRRYLRKGYHCGWISNSDLYLVNPTVLSKFVLMDIEKLGGWAI